MIWHIIPIDDIEPHDELSTCHCEPKTEIVNNDIIVIHNSFDVREGVEFVNELLSNHSSKP